MSKNMPLSTVDFSEVAITKDGNVGRHALGKSGARAYTRLPIYNGIDLETFCPGGSNSNIAISDESPFKDVKPTVKEIDESFPGWGIALIVSFAILAVGIAGFVFYMIGMEKKGKPIFSESKNLLT